MRDIAGEVLDVVMWFDTVPKTRGVAEEIGVSVSYVQKTYQLLGLVALMPNVLRRDIADFMANIDGSATDAAEQAANQFNLYEDDWNIPEWVFQLAMEVINEDDGGSS